MVLSKVSSHGEKTHAINRCKIASEVMKILYVFSTCSSVSLKLFGFEDYTSLIRHVNHNRDSLNMQFETIPIAQLQNSRLPKRQLPAP
jgi:hypothetical protein